MQNELNVLLGYLEDGLCLHGSQRYLKILEPRQATPTSSMPSQNQNAVYASKECVRPCIMATIHRANLTKGCRFGWEFKKGSVVVRGKNVKLGEGFIYALPPDTFEDLEGEFISFKPVVPRAVVRVTPEILSLFPNLKINIKT